MLGWNLTDCREGITRSVAQSPVIRPTVFGAIRAVDDPRSGYGGYEATEAGADRAVEQPRPPPRRLHAQRQPIRVTLPPD